MIWFSPDGHAIVTFTTRWLSPSPKTQFLRTLRQEPRAGLDDLGPAHPIGLDD